VFGSSTRPQSAEIVLIKFIAHKAAGGSLKVIGRREVINRAVRFG